MNREFLLSILVLSFSIQLVTSSPLKEIFENEITSAYWEENLGVFRENGIPIEDTFYSRQERQALRNRQRTWTTRTVPYVIDTAFDDDQREAITSAIYELSNVIGTGCISFREKKDGDIDYIQILQGDTFSSDLGRQGGCQDLTLSYISKGHIFHLLLHSLGITLEHNRPDRNNYVTILWDHIMPRYQLAFNRWRETDVTLAEDYDFYSIMHYPLNAYQTSENLTTIEPLDGYSLNRDLIGQRTNLTAGDLRKIRNLYECDIKTCRSPGTLQNGTMKFLPQRDNDGFSVGQQIENSCEPGFELIGPKLRGCTDNGNWTGDTPVCLSVNQGKYHYCNFDDSDLCGWKSTWKWTNFPTESENTGPTWDHTFSNSMGSYVYAEGEKMLIGVNFTLASPPLELQQDIDYCLRFQKSMRGEHMGVLHVYSQACGMLQDLEDFKGNQGDQWSRTNMRITFPSCTPEADEFKIIFTAEAGLTYESDIAVDDVLIADCDTMNKYLKYHTYNSKTSIDGPWPAV